MNTPFEDVLDVPTFRTNPMDSSSYCQLATTAYEWHTSCQSVCVYAVCVALRVAVGLGPIE